MISRLIRWMGSAVVLIPVQNVSQSIEVLDLRTERDLQYVRNTESLMKVLNSRLKVAADRQNTLAPRNFQVRRGPRPQPPRLTPGTGGHTHKMKRSLQ
eukprot:gi/632972757/ref/XP_007902816.1/ PREDICTED: noelin-2-like [Callorhinchus milii]